MDKLQTKSTGLGDGPDYQLSEDEGLEYVNALMLSFRHLLVRMQEERCELGEKLRRARFDIPIPSTTTSSNISSGPISAATSQSLPTNITSSLDPTPQSAPSTIPLQSGTNTRSSVSSTNNSEPVSPNPRPLTSATTSASTQATISSGTSSNLIVTENSDSTRPPPYKSIIKPSNPEAPKPPARTRRRSTLSNSGLRSGRSSNMTSQRARGALIVLEGLDRVGKSTLAQKLIEHLQRIKQPVTSCRFPDRSTPVGLLINDLLKDSSKKVDDRTLHLLFSANRWELNKKLRNTINQGTTVIVDRYSYSGIAYSSAKREVSMDWCCGTEKGLPKPDLVIYLELTKDAQRNRPGFGGERFETTEFQELVRHKYEDLMKISYEDWVRIDVEDKSPEQILAEVLLPLRRSLDDCANTLLGSLSFRSS